MAPALPHVKSAEAVDDNTLVIHYDAGRQRARAAGAVLHRPPARLGAACGGERQRPEDLPPRAGPAGGLGRRLHDQGVREEGHHRLHPVERGSYGEPSNAEAVTLTYFTNSDSMISELHQENLDWVDQVPFNAVKVLEEDDNIVVNEGPGAEINEHHLELEPAQAQDRELLDPQVKEAFSIASTASGSSRSSSTGTPPWSRASPAGDRGRDGEPEPRAARVRLRRRQPDARRPRLHARARRRAWRLRPRAIRAGRPPDEYEIITPNSTDFNVDRSFEIVQWLAE